MVDVGVHVGHVVGKNEIHAHQVTADFRLAVADDDSVCLHKSIVGENLAGVSVDHHLFNFLDRQQGFEDPPE